MATGRWHGPIRRINVSDAYFTRRAQAADSLSTRCAAGRRFRIELRCFDFWLGAISHQLTARLKCHGLARRIMTACPVKATRLPVFLPFSLVFRLFLTTRLKIISRRHSGASLSCLPDKRFHHARGDRHGCPPLKSVLAAIYFASRQQVAPFPMATTSPASDLTGRFTRHESMMLFIVGLRCRPQRTEERPFQRSRR